MRLCLHLPSSIDMPGSSLQQQRRLQQAIARSFEQVAATLSLSQVQIELVQAEIRDNADQIEPVQVEARGSSDHTYLARLPTVAVYQKEDGSYIYAGECHYGEAKSLAHALEQGTSLFDRSSYAVLQAEGTDRFYVVQVGNTAAIALQKHVIVAPAERDGQASFGNRADQDVQLEEQGDLEGISGGAPQECVIVALIDGDRQASFRNRADQSAMNFAATLGVATHDSRRMLDFIVMMNRSLFAEMPWEKRVEYLLLLLHAWTGKREESAILEIIYSTRSIAELEALFALLRERGKYRQLFKDLDERTYKLLQLLSEFIDDDPLDWRYLVSLLLDMNMLPAEPLLMQPDHSRETQNTVFKLHAWLQDVSENPGFRFASVDESTHGLAYLTEFLWLVEKARQDDLQAQAFVTEMVVHAGAGSVQALLGLRYAEKLAQPTTMERDEQHRTGTGIDGTLDRQLRALLVFDLLADCDELCLAPQNAESQPQRLAALTDALNAWQPQGVDIAGVEPGLAARLKHSMISAGGMTAQMMKGLQALLKYTVWDQAAILDLIENIPSASLQAFLRTITFVSPSFLERWEAPALRELAAHPAALAFIREAGCDLMHTTLQYMGDSWEALDIFLQKLAIKHDYIGNALDYRWFLHRMEKGEKAAFAEVAAIELNDIRLHSTEDDEGAQWQR